MPGCGNCDASLEAGQRYCPSCGQRAPTHRLTLHEVGHEFLHALVHVDRSVLALVRGLLLRPGHVARDYVSGRRRRYYGPFGFLVVVVALASAGIALTGFSVVTSSAPNRVGDFLQAHANLVFLLQAPFLALACRLLALRGRYNVAEYGVLACYTSGMHVLFYALVVIPAWVLVRGHAGWLPWLYGAYLPLWPLYFGMASAQFHGGSRWRWFGAGVLAVVLVFLFTQLLADAMTRLFA